MGGTGIIIVLLLKNSLIEPRNINVGKCQFEMSPLISVVKEHLAIHAYEIYFHPN